MELPSSTIRCSSFLVVGPIHEKGSKEVTRVGHFTKYLFKNALVKEIHTIRPLIPINCDFLDINQKREFV
jgi:hypothetical protein